MTGGRRDAPARQRTLRATIEWSHELLDDELRAAFRRLAVFTGAFTLESAESVAGADVAELDGLVEASLVKTVDPDRFLMLETIREFALEELERAGEVDDLRRRHAEHFLAVAQDLGLTTEAIEQRRHRGHQAALVELGNLRAALDWAAEFDPRLGLDLLLSLGIFWTRAPGEATVRLDRLLALVDDLPPDVEADGAA